MNRLCLLAAGLALATPAAAQPYTIKLKLNEGDRAEVQEKRVSDLKITWQGRGHAGGQSEQTTVSQRYTEEVRKAQPDLRWRSYEESTRLKKAPNLKPEAIPTSLQGREVLVQGLHMGPSGEKFEISKEDRERMRFDRLVLALLPPHEVVASGESWKIAGPALTSSLFANGIPAQNQSSWAKVDLKRVRMRKGTETATMKVKVKIAIAGSQQIPAIDMTLSGDLKWSLTDGRMLEARLRGPVTYSHQKVKTGEEGRWEARGTTRWSYKAKLLPSRAPAGKANRLAGEPPPPGTRVLVCGLDERHRVEISKYPNCLLCGKKLNKKHRCPKDHPWVWQFCPHDGAPLQPE